MISLDLLSYQNQLRTKKVENKKFIFDPIRKKYLVLQPEELVRQLLVLFLIHEKKISKNRIGIEKSLKVNTLNRRLDILIYDDAIQPQMLIECKAPSVKIDQSTFEQIARYNLPLQVPYLLVTNGLSTYCCKMDYEKETFEFLDELPNY